MVKHNSMSQGKLMDHPHVSLLRVSRELEQRHEMVEGRLLTCERVFFSS